MARTQQRSICSFCGKRQDQTQRLIAGPGGVYICDACVDLCAEIIQEEGAVTHRTDEGALARRGDPQARLWRALERQPGRFAAGERVFDALLTLGYRIDIQDDGHITATNEQVPSDAVPSLLEGQVQPDLTITWRDEPRAHQVLFHLRIAELRARQHHRH